MPRAGLLSRLREIRAWRAIGWGGLAAGTLDITFAFVYHGLRGTPPARILKSIASGLLGRGAYEGGWEIALLGLALHFLIAFTACGIYYAASRWLTPLARHPWAYGPLYGIAVFFFMQLVVLPLSAVPWEISLGPQALVSGLLAHIFCVGLPIALAVRAVPSKPAWRQLERPAAPGV